MRPFYEMVWGAHRMVFGTTTRIMGIVNVTPDSFSDGGRFFKTEAAIQQGLLLTEAGADILDIGGESTRPFADPVSVNEEIRRVVPVIESLSKRIRIPISIDTSKAVVARDAIEAGASMINDVSALRFDPDMTTVAREFSVPVILMHMLGTPRTMQRTPCYEDVVGEVFSFLKIAMDRAEEGGIPKSRLIVDPGIGFGKTVNHNLTLIAELQKFHELGAPVLIGPSRKAFIRNIIKSESDQEMSPDMPVVQAGTQAAVAAAILNGAHIVRVHDISSTRPIAIIADAIARARPQPDFRFAGANAK